MTVTVTPKSVTSSGWRMIIEKPRNCNLSYHLSCWLREAESQA